MAYGERNTIEAGISFIEKLKNLENKRVISIAIKIYAIDILKRDLGFFLVNSAISRGAA